MKKYLFLGWMFIVAPFSFGQNTSCIIIQKKVNNIQLSICLPPNYDVNKSYKVIYFNDGQTVFGEQGLNANGTMEALLNDHLIEPIIIVGLHSDENRTSNYVPYEDASLRLDFGTYTPNAKAYSDKIIKKIIPYIEKNYKTNSIRGIAGYSFGGLHANWMALNYPEQFSFSAGLSPSYWVKDFEIFKEGSKASKDQIFYFDVGTGEWNYYVPMLLHSQLPILKNSFYYEDFQAQHIIEDWRGQRIKNILLLFAGTTDLTKYEWEIQPEFIKSSYNGKLYLRVNPIITYSDGLKCSISYAAQFVLLNPEDGVVNKDGSFRFNSTKDLIIKVIYQGEEKTITINYAEVNAQ